MPCNTKPPLGVKPRYLHDSLREVNLFQAIKRYLDADIEIPIEWVQEYNELLSRRNQCEEKTAQAVGAATDGTEK